MEINQNTRIFYWILLTLIVVGITTGIILDVKHL